MSNAIGVLLRVAIELAARINSTLHYLDDVARDADSPQVSDPIRRALLALWSRLPETIRQVQEASPSNPTESVRVFRENLADFSRWFITIHELLVYLPRRPVAPEAVALLDTSFGELFRRQNPSIILGGLFNALEYDFFQLMKRRLPAIKDILVAESENIVLQLPLCDGAAPSAWPILAHEMGHAIDQASGFSARVSARIVTDHSSRAYRLVSSWAKELCADLIAAKALGPASFFPLLSLEYCVYPLLPFHTNPKPPTHPPTRWRLEAISAFLRRTSDPADHLSSERTAYAEASELSLHIELPDDALRAQRRTALQNQYDGLILPLAELLENELATLALGVDPTDPTSLARCVRRLEQRVPISAQGQPRETLRAELDTYRQENAAVDSETRRTAFSELLGRFKEEPVGLASILLACHVKRSHYLSDVVSGRVDISNELALTEMTERLRELDLLIANSINTSIVHSILTTPS